MDTLQTTALRGERNFNRTVNRAPGARANVEEPQAAPTEFVSRMKTRIYIVDDHALVRRGLVRIARANGLL